MINGTVMGPVVTPPESNATARNSFGTKMDKIKTSGYNPNKVYCSDMPNLVRSIDITKNSPTPAATVMIMTISGTAGTCRANTCRSGSAIVTVTPIKKQISAIKHRLFELPSLRPI